MAKRWIEEIGEWRYKIINNKYLRRKNGIE